MTLISTCMIFGLWPRIATTECDFTVSFDSFIRENQETVTRSRCACCAWKVLVLGMVTQPNICLAVWISFFHDYSPFGLPHLGGRSRILYVWTISFKRFRYIFPWFEDGSPSSEFLCVRHQTNRNEFFASHETKYNTWTITLTPTHETVAVPRKSKTIFTSSPNCVLKLNLFPTRTQLLPSAVPTD